MSNLLLPYSNWIEYTRSVGESYYDVENPFGWEGFQSPHRPKPLQPERDLGKLANNDEVQSILSIDACPYCKSGLKTTDIYRGGGQEWKRADAVVCLVCGWWVYCFSKNKFYPYESFRNEFYEAAVYSFDIERATKPLSQLREEIRRQRIDLREVSPKDLELLVGAVFRDYIGERVQHIGGPGDGGIDLFVGPSVAIQVKRREHEKPREAVSTVRDLVGSIVLAEVPRGIVVSTAEDFSQPAKDAASSQSLRRRGIEIDLYNYEMLRELINLTAVYGDPWLQVPRIQGLHRVWGLNQRVLRTPNRDGLEKAGAALREARVPFFAWVEIGPVRLPMEATMSVGPADPQITAYTLDVPDSAVQAALHVLGEVPVSDIVDPKEAG